MKLDAIDHLALITHDLTETIHFYRDLLGLPLTAALSQDGVRHYLFALGPTQLAFFAYADAAAVPRKRHGVCTAEPRGFDHVSFSTSRCEELFAWRDLLRAAGIEVTGPVDHGAAWSIYFFDPNGIALEISWMLLDVLELPIIADEEAVLPPPRLRPSVVQATPRNEWRATPGAGQPLRARLIETGRARLREEVL